MFIVILIGNDTLLFFVLTLFVVLFYIVLMKDFNYMELKTMRSFSSKVVFFYTSISFRKQFKTSPEDS